MGKSYEVEVIRREIKRTHVTVNAESEMQARHDALELVYTGLVHFPREKPETQYSTDEVYTTD